MDLKTRFCRVYDLSDSSPSTTSLTSNRSAEKDLSGNNPIKYLNDRLEIYRRIVERREHLLKQQQKHNNKTTPSSTSVADSFVSNYRMQRRRRRQRTLKQPSSKDDEIAKVEACDDEAASTFSVWSPVASTVITAEASENSSAVQTDHLLLLSNKNERFLTEEESPSIAAHSPVSDSGSFPELKINNLTPACDIPTIRKRRHVRFMVGASALSGICNACTQCYLSPCDAATQSSEPAAAARKSTTTIDCETQCDDIVSQHPPVATRDSADQVELVFSSKYVQTQQVSPTCRDAGVQQQFDGLEELFLTPATSTHSILPPTTKIKTHNKKLQVDSFSNNSDVHLPVSDETEKKEDELKASYLYMLDRVRQKSASSNGSSKAGLLLPSHPYQQQKVRHQVAEHSPYKKEAQASRSGADDVVVPDGPLVVPSVRVVKRANPYAKSAANNHIHPYHNKIPQVLQKGRPKVLNNGIRDQQLSYATVKCMPAANTVDPNQRRSTFISSPWDTNRPLVVESRESNQSDSTTTDDETSGNNSYAIADLDSANSSIDSDEDVRHHVEEEQEEIVSRCLSEPLALFAAESLL